MSFVIEQSKGKLFSAYWSLKEDRQQGGDGVLGGWCGKKGAQENTEVTLSSAIDHQDSPEYSICGKEFIQESGVSECTCTVVLGKSDNRSTSLTAYNPTET